MENCIYMFYNKLTGRYQGVFSFETDAKAQYMLRDPKSFDRNELEVVKVGTFTVADGMITSTAPVRLEIPSGEDDPLPVTEAK